VSPEFIDSADNRLSLKMTAKLSSDLLKTLEREMITSWKTPQQAVVGEASRRFRHGNPGGPIQNNILHWLQTLHVQV
jgi:hypothetical protein